MYSDGQLEDTIHYHDLRVPAPMYNQLSWKAIYGFADVASTSPWVRNIIFDSLPISPVNRGYDESMQKVKTKKHDTPVSIQLSHIVLWDSLERGQGIYSLEGEPGTNLVGVFLYLTLQTYWNIYRKDTGFYHLISKDTLILQGIGVNYSEAVANLPDISENIRDLVYQGGVNTAYKLYPVWLDVNRVYYIHLTNKKMVEAEKKAGKNQWMDAAAIWNELAASKRKSLAARAAFNMALAAEINDHLDIAESWLKKSFILRPHKTTLKYLQVIRQRQKDLQKIMHTTSVPDEQNH
ncbi:MAG: hypothetical protein GXO83_02355 [Chlorobi bacterium]|nr:hypothetical protein [Chlorobiota bacterium]